MAFASLPLPGSAGARPVAGGRSVEGWSSLPSGLLQSSRGPQVCLTCHFFRHHPAADGIPVLACHLHQGRIGHGEHLTRRCPGWTREFHLERGWAPEV